MGCAENGEKFHVDRAINVQEKRLEAFQPYSQDLGFLCSGRREFLREVKGGVPQYLTEVLGKS